MVKTFSDYLKSQNFVASSVDNSTTLENFVGSIWNLAQDHNSLVFTIGNGGSASTAEHFSADLAQMEIRTGHAIRSFCLNSQIALSSALANDYDYSRVIEKQLSPFKNSNYILVAFTASGNSSNILNAVNFALEQNKEVYCFIGFDGGKLFEHKKAKQVFFPDSNRNYGIVENVHLAATHYVIDRLIEKFMENK